MESEELVDDFGGSESFGEGSPPEFQGPSPLLPSGELEESLVLTTLVFVRVLRVICAILILFHIGSLFLLFV